MHIALPYLLAAATPLPDAHGGEEAGGQLPQLVFETWPGQIFWLGVSFLVLYLLLSRALLPRIGSVIEERRDRVADDLDAANRMQRDAEEARERHEKALADARAKAHAIAAETRERIAGELAEEAKGAEAEYAEKAEEAEARIRAATETALAGVAAVAGEAAGALVEKLGGGAPDASAVSGAIAAVKSDVRARR